MSDEETLITNDIHALIEAQADLIQLFYDFLGDSATPEQITSDPAFERLSAQADGLYARYHDTHPTEKPEESEVEGEETPFVVMPKEPEQESKALTCTFAATSRIDCAGPVEWRLYDNGIGYRQTCCCEAHFETLLDSMGHVRELLSPVAPEWFDEGYAGERWDDDY